MKEKNKWVKRKRQEEKNEKCMVTFSFSFWVQLCFYMKHGIERKFDIIFSREKDKYDMKGESDEWSYVCTVYSFVLRIF